MGGYDKREEQHDIENPMFRKKSENPMFKWIALAIHNHLRRAFESIWLLWIIDQNEWETFSFGHNKLFPLGNIHGSILSSFLPYFSKLPPFLSFFFWFSFLSSSSLFLFSYLSFLPYFPYNSSYESWNNIPTIHIIIPCLIEEGLRSLHWSVNMHTLPYFPFLEKYFKNMPQIPQALAVPKTHIK